MIVTSKSKTAFGIGWVVACLAAFEASGDILFDSLCITDNCDYDSGYACECSSGSFYGDLQAAQAFSASSGVFVTRVVYDYLFLGGFEPTKFCVSFYAARDSDGDCMVDNDAIWYDEVPFQDLNIQEFDDPKFGTTGFRIAASVRAPYLQQGTWYTCGQPSSPDIMYSVVDIDPQCFSVGSCDPVVRDGGERNPCCDGLGAYGFEEWRAVEAGSALAMRIEGIPAGDCTDGESVTAKCKTRDGGRRGRVVVKVSNGQPNGTVTALLDPPDPRSTSIPLDATGRGKGKFRGVPLGDHRVFVCDSIVDVTCAP